MLRFHQNLSLHLIFLRVLGFKKRKEKSFSGISGIILSEKFSTLVLKLHFSPHLYFLYFFYLLPSCFLLRYNSQAVMNVVVQLQVWPPFLSLDNI
jgi:hypothetical protein